VPPTIYYNVPAGYAQLVPALEAAPEFAARFFSRLRLVFNAAAALPAALRDRLAAVAERTVGHQIPVTGSWGATETAPAVTSAHFPFTDARLAEAGEARRLHKLLVVLASQPGRRGDHRQGLH
jgi:feruloyl-CoA synthase